MEGMLGLAVMGDTSAEGQDGVSNSLPPRHLPSSEPVPGQRSSGSARIEPLLSRGLWHRGTSSSKQGTQQPDQPATGNGVMPRDGPAGEEHMPRIFRPIEVKGYLAECAVDMVLERLGEIR